MGDFYFIITFVFSYLLFTHSSKMNVTIKIPG